MLNFDDHLHDGNKHYYKFTGRQQLDKAMHALEGILKGIGADASANEKEVLLLEDWLGENRQFERHHPFNEVIPLLDGALEDRVFDAEELADALFVCGQFTTNEIYFDNVTADMQRLQGILGGIAADGVITMAELDMLSAWMADCEHLRTCWPYDELEGLLSEVRKDRFIDSKEHDMLRAFFAEFTRLGKHRAVTPPPLNSKELTSRGICAVCPDVKFEGKTFCFTGDSSRMGRDGMELLVQQRGAIAHPRVTMEIDYLVVGAQGNPTWAFCCYGRKIQKAIDYRKKGCRVLIVHEFDFWDAIEGTKGAMPESRDIQVPSAVQAAEKVMEEK